jgi:hypothetical protein
MLLKSKSKSKLLAVQPIIFQPTCLIHSSCDLDIHYRILLHGLTFLPIQNFENFKLQSRLSVETLLWGMAKPTTFEVTSNELKANGVPVFISLHQGKNT